MAGHGGGCPWGVAEEVARPGFTFTVNLRICDELQANCDS